MRSTRWKERVLAAKQLSQLWYVVADVIVLAAKQLSQLWYVVADVIVLAAKQLSQLWYVVADVERAAPAPHQPPHTTTGEAPKALSRQSKRFANNIKE